MRRLLVRGALFAALLSTFAYAPRVLGNPGTVPPADVMTRIRQFLGVQPRTVSVGGTRSRQQAVVCLLAPGPIQKVGEVSQIQLVESSPNLVFGTPLNEVEIRSGSAVLWSQLATSKGPIQGRIPWPISPIKSNQRLELAMRPRGAAGGDWAVVHLIPKSQSTIIQPDYRPGQSSFSYSGDIEDLITKNNPSLLLADVWDVSTDKNPLARDIRKALLDKCS
jgi:hypothetical protein